MSSNINPSTWTGFNLSLRNKAFDGVMQVFLSQLSQFATQVQQQLASIQTGNHTAVASVGGITNASGSTVITANLAIAAPSTMTLNNVADATTFDFRIANTSGSGQLFKIAVNKPGSGAYSVLVMGSFSGAETDMTVTGFTVPNNSAIYLRGIAQLSAGILVLGYV